MMRLGDEYTQAKEIILKKVVEKYKGGIIFMLSKDYYIMEVVEPRTVWIPEMRYEVVEDVTIVLVDHIISNPRYTSKERYGTY